MSDKRLSALRALAIAAGLVFAGLSVPAGSLAQGVSTPTPAQGGATDRVGIDQKLNEQVPLDTLFKDDAGKDVKLSDYFGKRPVILVMPFYRCAGTCILEMEG